MPDYITPDSLLAVLGNNNASRFEMTLTQLGSYGGTATTVIAGGLIWLWQANGVANGDNIRAAHASKGGVWVRQGATGTTGGGTVDTDARTAAANLTTALKVTRPPRGGTLAYAGDLETIIVGREPWTRAASTATADGIEVVTDTLGRKWQRKVLPEISLRDDFQMRPGRNETQALQAAMVYLTDHGGGTMIVDDLFNVASSTTLAAGVTLRAPGYRASWDIRNGYVPRYGFHGGGGNFPIFTWADAQMMYPTMLGVSLMEAAAGLSGPTFHYMVRPQFRNLSFHASLGIGIKANLFDSTLDNCHFGEEGDAKGSGAYVGFRGLDLGGGRTAGSELLWPGNINKFVNCRFYHTVGDYGYRFRDQYDLEFIGGNVEQNYATIGTMRFQDCEHVYFSSVWFEHNRAEYDVVLTGSSDHIELRHPIMVTGINMKALILNQTGRDLDLRMINPRPLHIGRTLRENGTVRVETRFTEDHVGYDRAFSEYKYNGVINQVDAPDGWTIDPNNPVQPSIAYRVYPYTIRDTLGGAGRGATLDADLRIPPRQLTRMWVPPVPTLNVAVGGGTLTVPVETVLHAGADRVTVERAYTFTPPATAAPVHAFTPANILAGWYIVSAEVSCGDFNNNGYLDTCSWSQGTARVRLDPVNTTAARQLRVRFVMAPV